MTDVGGATVLAAEAATVTFGVGFQETETEYCGTIPDGSAKLKKELSHAHRADRCDRGQIRAELSCIDYVKLILSYIIN